MHTNKLICCVRRQQEAIVDFLTFWQSVNPGLHKHSWILRMAGWYSFGIQFR